MRGLLLCAVALVLSLESCNGDVRRRKAVFIFCDVTNSLNKSESEKVVAMAASILNNLPAGTEYRVYPILVETDRLYPINETETVIPPREESKALQDVLEQQRQEELNAKLARLYQLTNKNKHDNRTCILNAISFVGNELRGFPREKYDHELIIISDMLEECDETPLKRKIDIRKADISEELKLANNFPQVADLSSAVINVITPATEDTYLQHETGSRPPMDALKQFWGTILTRCNVSPEEQKKPERYFWSNGALPRRFVAQR